MCRASYIEGRLRLVEKARHRRSSKGSTGGTAHSPGSGEAAAEGAVAANGALPAEGGKCGEDLKAAAAQADAVMAALLQEETVAKVTTLRAACCVLHCAPTTHAT